MSNPVNPELIRQSTDKYASIPLPADMVPTNAMEYDAFMDAMSDDDILAMPPHVLVHLMRTAAQGGLQVVSPRQIPSTNIVKRTMDDSTNTFIHVAGSDASANLAWPVPPGHSPPDLRGLEYEPLRKSGSALAHRGPSRAEPLIALNDASPSAIQRCWVKARANCSLQAREEIGGDADAMAKAYEAIYARVPGELLSDPGVAVTSVTDLRAHAVINDTSLARQLAPTHVRRVLSVAVGPSCAGAFGPYRAYDWTAARVIAETKYNLTAQNEHLPLVGLSVKAGMTVGDLLGAPYARAGVSLVYHPTGGTVWSYAPHTFAVTVNEQKIVPRTKVHAQIEAELSKGAKFASPIAAALSAKAAVSWVASTTSASVLPTMSSDLFFGMPTLSMSPTAKMYSVSRTMMKSVKSMVFDAFESAPLLVRVKMVRAVLVVREGLELMGAEAYRNPTMVNTIASRFVQLNSHMNARMTSTAMVRGESIETWAKVASKILPKGLRSDTLSGFLWAKLAVHCMFKPPDESWQRLVSALAVTTRAMMTPPGRHSSASECRAGGDHHAAILARIMAAQAYHTDVFSASYDGAALGCVILARVATDNGMVRLSRIFRATSLGWTLRQRYVRRIVTTFGPIVWDIPDGCQRALFDNSDHKIIRDNAVVVRAASGGIWDGWKTKANHDSVQMRIPSNGEGMMSELHDARGCEGADLELGVTAMAHLRNTLPQSVRFGISPKALASALETNLYLACKDASEVVRAYATEMLIVKEAEQAMPPSDPFDLPRIAIPETTVEAFAASIAELVGDTARDGWYWLAQMEPDEASFISDEAETDETTSAILEAEYPSMDDFLRALDAKDAEGGHGEKTDAFV